jgi:hypothetical protein
MTRLATINVGYEARGLGHDAMASDFGLFVSWVDMAVNSRATTGMRLMVPDVFVGRFRREGRAAICVTVEPEATLDRAVRAVLARVLPAAGTAQSTGLTEDDVPELMVVVRSVMRQAGEHFRDSMSAGKPLLEFTSQAVVELGPDFPARRLQGSPVAMREM